MRITQLWQYPVKSLRGVPVGGLEMEPWGPVGDRRWAVVDERGYKLTARAVPELLLLDAEVVEDGAVTLRSRGGDTVTAAVPHDGAPIEVNFSRLPTATDAGEAAAAFLTVVLGRPARLVWQPDPTARPANPTNGGLPGEVLSLADAGPLLLTSEASLAQLQQWVGDQPLLSMRRFRPNVVVDGDQPFTEDAWRSVRLGSVPFRVQAPCDRCLLTTIDPVTLERGAEPIQALEAHHAWDGKTFFGVRLVPTGSGRVGVGDAVVADAGGG